MPKEKTLSAFFLFSYCCFTGLGLEENQGVFRTTTQTGERNWIMTIQYEEIAKRAFEIWKKQGGIEGKEQDHWLEAEAALRQEQLIQQKGKKISSKAASILKVPEARTMKT